MFERLRERITYWATYRETIRQLGFLDRRMLDDAHRAPGSPAPSAATAGTAPN